MTYSGDIDHPNAPQELAQIVNYGNPDHYPRPVRETPDENWALIDGCLVSHRHHPLRVLGHKVADALAWFGRPFVTLAELNYNLPDGPLFGSDGTVYSQDPNGCWQGVNNAHRMPAPPWPGWEYRQETDPATGWPFYRLVKVLPDGCADCTEDDVRPYEHYSHHMQACEGWWCRAPEILEDRDTATSWTAETLATGLVEQIRARGFRVIWADSPWGETRTTNGTTDPVNMTVTLARHPVNGETVASVAAHELGHIVLDHASRQFMLPDMLEAMGFPIPLGSIGRPQAEMEAESVSAGVLEHFGISADAAPGYWAVWHGNADTAGQTIDYADMADHIANAVATIVDGLE